MALPAVKHLDPVVGVDVHSVMVTPGTPPVFLPHPHVGFMLDLREYVQAAKAVVGCIAMMIVQEKVTEYIEDHPEDVKKLEHLADEASQQVNKQLNDLMGGGKLPYFKDDPTVAEGVRLAKEANKLKNRISDDLGSNVGAGGSSGRPIFVNGMMRATAGTHAYHVPGLHFPLGESFVPPPAENPEPSNDGESFMGSKTVLANNDPMSFLALQALSCWSVGMEPPPHNSAHTDRTYPSMPSSVMLPIPAGRPVLVGGPPIMNMAAAAKGLFKAFQGSKWAKSLADKLNLKPGFLRCNVLKAEPVDATTGEVVVRQRDFTVAGRLPLVWGRHYASHNSYDGAVGVGWQTPADIRLGLMWHEDVIAAVAYFPDHSTAFDQLPTDVGWSACVSDWQHGYALYRQDDRLVLRSRAGIEYEFILPSQWMQTIGIYERDVQLTLPIERIADLNGNAWVFERDPCGCVTRITEWTLDGKTARAVECGRRGTVNGAANAAGWVTTMTLADADNRAYPLVQYEFDRDRNLIAAVDAMAHSRYFEYASDHRLVRHANARGSSFYYSYLQHNDGVWRVNHAWGENGLFDYQFAYDRARKETRITNSRGYTSVLQLNWQDMPVAEIDPLGNMTSYQYDSQGRTNTRTDPSGCTTKWHYDRFGSLVTQTLPDGSAIRTEYDSNHRPVCVALIGGRQWRYEWDMRGNLLAQTDPSGSISNYTYDKYGQLVEHAGPRGTITRLEYDQNGNLAARTNALGCRTQYRYDAHGYVIEVINALGQRSHYEYDRCGNLAHAILPGEREIHCAYDADGNLASYRDPMGHVTYLDYTALGQVSRRRAPNGTTIEYLYDTEEQLIGVVNERGERYVLERDELGRIAVETDYWGQARRYRYGLAGELLSATDPLGQTIEYRYDQLGRIVQKRVPYLGHENKKELRVDNFTYDRNGDLACARNASRCVKFRYDKAGRVIEERQDDDFSISIDYDTDGNQTARRSQLNAGGKIVEHTTHYAYDALNLVSSIQIDDAAPIMLERDAIGRICAEQIGADLRRELSYEAGGQLALQKTLLTGAGALFASEYAYTANGELIEKHHSHDIIEHFEYDSIGQIIKHLDPTKQLHTYLYDSAGDLFKTCIRELHHSDAMNSTQFDPWIREGEYDGCRYEYDRSGNLFYKRSAAQDLTLRWDAAGQLTETEAVHPSIFVPGDVSIHISTQYEYDAFQRRVRKIVHAGSPSTPKNREISYVSHFFWDGNTLVGEYSSSGNWNNDPTLLDEDDESRIDQFINSISRKKTEDTSLYHDHTYEWIYYPNTHRPLAAIHTNLARNDASSKKSEKLTIDSEAIYFYQNDPNGAPIRIHDANGIVAWEASYSPTGDIKLSEACGIYQPIRFQGQYFDLESGLHYNRYRYIDPRTNRFISQDPIRLSGGFNLYRYAPNIFEWIDPLGLLTHQELESLSKLYLKPGYFFTQGPANDPGLAEFISDLKNNDVDVLGNNLKINNENRNVGEIDVLTSQGGVQFKNGSSAPDDITGQIRKDTEPYMTVPVIGFINGVNSEKAGVRKASNRTVKYSCQNGFLVTGSLSDAIALLRR